MLSNFCSERIFFPRGAKRQEMKQEAGQQKAASSKIIKRSRVQTLFRANFFPRGANRQEIKQGAGQQKNCIILGYNDVSEKLS